MSRNVVDLTLSDSDDEPGPKRRRAQPDPLVNDSDVEIVESGASDVEILPQPGPRVSAGTDNVSLGDDEELVITNTTGQVATRDLPHPRPDCADHRFTVGVASANASCCPQCYCFVCDVKASECRFWGTGVRERDHANARPLGYWRRLREEARAGNRGLVNAEYHGTGPIGNGSLPPRSQEVVRFLFQRISEAAAAAAGPTVATSDPTSADHRSGAPTPRDRTVPLPAGQRPSEPRPEAAGPSTSAAGPGMPVRVQPCAGAGPSGNGRSALAPLPVNPVEVKVQAGAVTLPSGPCSMRQLPDPNQDHMAFELGTLRLYVKAVRGLTVAALAERLERFGFYYEAGKKLQHYGGRFTLDRLLESTFGFHGGIYKSKAHYCKLLPLPALPEETVPLPTDRVRKVLVVDCLGRTRATYIGVRLNDGVKRADLLSAVMPMLRPLVSPAAELLHLMTLDSLEDNSACKVVEAQTNLDDKWFNEFKCASRRSGHVIVFRTAHHPAPTWDASAWSTSRQLLDVTQMPVYGHSSGGSGVADPAWVTVQVRQLNPPPPESSVPMFVVSGTSVLSVPLLVPLRKDHTRGGRDAAREVNAALLRGLQAYRTTMPLVPACAQPEIVVRGNRYRLSYIPADVPNEANWNTRGDTIGLYQVNRLPQLIAVFPQNMPESSYRLDEMRTPAVDSTATPEAMSASENAIHQAKIREASLRERKALPANCINELIIGSRRLHPEDKHSSPIERSVVALDVRLKPSNRPGASEREGKLVIKVYGWTSNALGRKSLFLPWDDWPALRKEAPSGFTLSNTIMLLATGATDRSERTLRSIASHGSIRSSAGGSYSAAATADDDEEEDEQEGGADNAASSSAVRAAMTQRVRAERARAKEMFAQVQAFSSRTGNPRSINALLDYMQSGERPPAEQPDGLMVAMRPYQLQSLGFMLELERLVDVPPSADAAPSTSEAGAAVQPRSAAGGGRSDVLAQGGFRWLFWVPVTNSKGQHFWYSPVLGRMSLDVPEQTVGGFLAEEMGLGKTVEVMALTLANPAPPTLVPGTQLPCGRILSKATLVVCAVSLVGQWQTEAQNKTMGSCRIHPYHGQNRIRDPKRLATEYDVVITTYQTLQSDHAGHGKASADPCKAIKWHRIVFDEGHMLKSSSAKMCKAATELVSDRKWVCTGTPISNAVEDLMGQFAVLHLAPFSKKTYFDSYVKMPFLAGGFCGPCCVPLLYTIRQIMIRHTKAQNLGGEGVLQLPLKTETDVPVYLTPEEQALYLKAHKEAKSGWEKLKTAGARFVNSHLFTAMSMLMPLRRICSGGLLGPSDLAVPDPENLVGLTGPGGPGAGGADVGGGAEVPVPDDISECPICVDTLEQPVVTPCNHWYCRECLTGWINASAHHNCPACRHQISIQCLRRGVRPEPAAAAAAEGNKDEDDSMGPTPCESKLKALLAALRAMREEDPTAKALVFMQFGKTLDWLKPRLLAEGFGHRTITGDMTQKKRTEAIDSFQRDPSTCVFLLSVRSGAVGINLTAANHVFLLEPCMNPATEEQAIGRSWRMGQQRPVIVKRLYVKGSVEERIMEVVKERRAAGGGADTLAAAGPSSATRAVNTDLRISELDLMFREPQFPSAEEAAAAAAAD